MIKRIMLTIIGICGILMLVSCMNGDQNINKDVVIDETSGIVTKGGEPDGNEDAEDVLSITNSVTDEVFEYNESGKIIIIMYHKFAKEEKDEWTRSFDNFYKDLEYLYEKGYRSISLSDYINNDIKVPIGCTPVIFTFDDGSKSQFNLVKDDDGNFVANADSAVGIMEKFYAEHPDFGLNGTFYINQTGYFGSEGTRKERLEYLINKGFEIGNHTCNHINIAKAKSADEIQEEIGKGVKAIEELVGYEMTSLALPYGGYSKEFSEYIASGEYEGSKYNNKAILLVGSSPVSASNNKDVNLLKLPRVRARGGNKEVANDLYYWLDKMELDTSRKYIRLK